MSQSQKPEVKSMENGPPQDRSCTDMICCLIFIASVLAMAICAFIAYGQNHRELIGAIVDPDGRVCGVESMKDYPYAFIQMPFKDVNYSAYKASDILINRVCVASCPEDNTVTKLNCSVNSVVKTCEGKNSEEQPVSSDSKLNIYASVAVHSVCLPKSQVLTNLISDFSDKYKEQAASYIGNAETSFSEKKWLILASFFIGLALTFVYLLLVRFCVGVVIWVSVIAILALLVYGGYLAYAAGWLAVAIGLWVASFLYVVVFICCNYQRLKLAIKVYQAASRMVSGNMHLILVPTLVVLSTLLFIVWWVFSGALWVSRSLVAEKGDLFPGVRDMASNEMVYFYYYMFCGIWVIEWIKEEGIFTITAFATQWYYTERSQENHNLLRTSAYWALCKHIGSVAFGSFFVAVIVMLRIILEYVIKKTKSDQAGGVQAQIACCARCCLACLQKIVECINRTAFSFICLGNEKYCVSAAKGLKFALSNPIYMVIMSGVGEVVQMVGNLIISFSNTVIFYYMAGFHKEEGQSILVVLLVFLFSYVMAAVFMGVEATSADAMIICFFVDNEIQNQTGGKQKERAPEEFKALYQQM